jgi:hypothetical protein
MCFSSLAYTLQELWWTSNTLTGLRHLDGGTRTMTFMRHWSGIVFWMKCNLWRVWQWGSSESKELGVLLLLLAVEEAQLPFWNSPISIAEL